MVLAGCAAYRIHAERLGEWETLPPREARLRLRCDRIFAPRGEGRCSGLGVVVYAEAHLSDLLGRRVYFSLANPSMKDPLLSGSEIDARGILTLVPSQPLPRSFDAYLADAGIQFRFSRGKLLRLTGQPGAYRRMNARLLSFMERILSIGIARKYPEQCGAFKAMMLGQLNELSEEQNQLYRLSGTMHLFSISGLHIGFIAAVFHGFLRLLRLPAFPRLLLCLSTLWIYVDATGCSPSAVRSFLMVALIELALALRQPINALSCLTSATLLVLIAAPCQVFGASFQMSYGIVASLILFSGPLGEFLLTLCEPLKLLPLGSWTRFQRGAVATWRWTASALVAGLGASLVGLLTGLAYFALLTPGALLVNLALIPTSTLVLSAGMLSLFLGAVFSFSSALVTNYAGLVLLLLMEGFVRLCLRLPWMHMTGEYRCAWFGGASLCIMLCLCLWGYRRRWNPPWLFVCPPAFLLLVLFLGVRYAQTP
jgi:competence protein ComEC